MMKIMKTYTERYQCLNVENKFKYLNANISHLAMVVDAYIEQDNT